MCIFCDKGKEEEDRVEFSTFDSDRNVRTMATELQDTELLSKIGDLIAVETKYHIKFLVILRNRYRTLQTFIRSSREPFSTEEKMSESITLVELFNPRTFLFRLSELQTLYTTGLEDLEIRKVINKSRLKDFLLDHFPEAQEQYEGKHVVIVFKEGVSNMLKDAKKQ